MAAFVGPGSFICRLTKRPASELSATVANEETPAWTSAAGITWSSRESAVAATKLGSLVRLTLTDPTAELRTIDWDPARGRAVLRRDRLWSRPIYYAFAGDNLLITDSLRAMLTLLPTRPTLDLEALDAYLALEFFPAPLTPFRGIRKVGIEETCTIDLPTAAITSSTAPLVDRIPADFEAAAEETWQGFASTLEERSQQCGGELILFCSGGLDSTILAHAMRGRGRAIVLSYVDSWKDETARARETAQHAHLPLEETRLPPFAPEQLGDYARLLDEPLGGTANFAIRHLSMSIPRGSWVVGGHGSGVLSLMNVKHKDLHAARHVEPEESLVERFAERATYVDADARAALLGQSATARTAAPVEAMVSRELPFQAGTLLALHAVIRRQMCVEEEMSQLWPILDAFDHVPVMPFFAPAVRERLDRLPESVLRDDRFERRLLKRIAERSCPGYTPQPRQLGYGLPLGEPAYPGEAGMRIALDAFAQGPLRHDRLVSLLDACRGASGAERFRCLRRLWTAVVLHAWLEHHAPGTG